MNTGNNLLFLVLSALLAFMSVTGVAGWINIRSAGISLSFPEDLFARVPAPLSITVTNGSRVAPLFLLRVSCAGADRIIPFLGRGEDTTVTHPLTPQQRGVLPPISITLSSSYPVGFFVRSRQFTHAPPAVAFPHPIPASPPSGPDGRRQEGSSPTEGGGTGELVTIREYRPGDPLRGIHWRISARDEDLRVTERSRDEGGSMVVNLAQIPGESLEERLSRATWLVLEGFRRGDAVGLSLPTRLIPPCRGRNCRYQILKELALHDEA
ncbi:MAG: DUF58 domain-containing protein [Desulfuromonadia bacterium]